MYARLIFAGDRDSGILGNCMGGWLPSGECWDGAEPFFNPGDCTIGWTPH